MELTFYAISDMGPVTEYTAPEILRGEKPTTKTDMFNLGLVLYRCYAGKNLFQGTEEQLKECITSFNGFVPPVVIPSNRASAHDAVDATYDDNRYYNSSTDAELSTEADMRTFTHAIRDIVKNLLCLQPAERPSTSRMLDSVKTLIHPVLVLETHKQRALQLHLIGEWTTDSIMECLETHYGYPREEQILVHSCISGDDAMEPRGIQIPMSARYNARKSAPLHLSECTPFTLMVPAQDYICEMPRLFTNTCFSFL